MIYTLPTRKSWRYFGFAIVLTMGLSLALAGLAAWDEYELAALPGQPAGPPPGRVSIIIKVPARLLELHSDGKIHKTYRIAVGKSETPTPLGDWIIIWKAYHSGDIFGTRFMGLDVPWGGYGIHGTNRPWSIGSFASKGCIRMRNADIEELFEWTPVGTPVRIEGRAGKISRTLKYQTYGQDVVLLQGKLRQLGYLEGRSDGFFNRDTEEALKRFQHDKKLKPTGVADRTVLGLLGL